MDVLEPFVDATWLAGNLDRVVVAELRWSLDAGDDRGRWERAHLPGSVFVSLDDDLAGPPSRRGGRHPLPTAEEFTSTLGRLGVADGDDVVVVDDLAGVVAARLVWMLRATGRSAAVLDGGLGAWEGPRSSGPVERQATSPQVRSWPPALLADAESTATAPLVLDVRDAARFLGETAGPDARAGHIPGAVSVPVADDLDPDQRLRPDAELARRYAPAADATPPAVVSCGSGVSACHALLVMERLGIPGRLFPGSFSAWAADPARPVETGP